MMLYLQWLALAHFSSQGAKNWAFCWMLEALFEVGQASIPDAVLDRMGLAKDDPICRSGAESLQFQTCLWKLFDPL